MIKQKIIFILLLWVSLILSSCSQFSLTPNHPTKAKDQYWVDKRDCETIHQNNLIEFHGVDEQGTLMYERIDITNCLKNKGWKY